LYVDDIVLTATSSGLLHRIIIVLQYEFVMKGPLHHFLGIVVVRLLDGLFLQQRQYTLDILECADMLGCKRCATPMDMQAKVYGDNAPVSDHTTYHNLGDAL
jgi:hypothetical protein